MTSLKLPLPLSGYGTDRKRNFTNIPDAHPAIIFVDPQIRRPKPIPIVFIIGTAVMFPKETVTGIIL